jgi:hypothetical protein
MSYVPEKQASEPKFTLVSVEKSEPPDGCEGGSWYRYIIERGRSTIVGSRSGTLQQVTTHAKEYAAELNYRAENGGGSTWAPRKRGRKPQTQS